jgi:PAS domain S-box-containing protein
VSRTPFSRGNSMQVELDPSILRRLDQFVSGCSVLAVAFGMWVLTGWMFHLARMKTILLGRVAVKANTAACFLLIGLALSILKRENTGIDSGWRLAAKIAAILASVVGLISFLEFAVGWNLGIDQLLFAAGAEDIPGSVRPGLMSPLAAFGFFGLGFVLLVLDSTSKLGRWSSQLLPCGVAIAAIFGVLDFVLDPTTTHTHISPITAFVLFLFAFGVMFARPQWGLGALVAGVTLGSALTRRLLPAAIFAPLVIGWLRWKGQNAGLLSDWAGVALMTGLLIVLLSGLTVWTGFTVDRSERERQRSQDSIGRLASIVECSSDAIIGKTLEGIVTDWNPGAEAIYGYSAQEIIGQPIFVAIPPNRREEFDTILDKIRRGQRVTHYVTERLRKDGQTVFLSLSVSPVTDKTGQIVGVSTVARDVTERRRAEENLRTASLYTRSLLEASLDPLVTISREGKITDVNQATEKVTGVSREQLIGSDFSDYFTDPESARQGYKRVFEQSTVQDYPLAIRSTGGKITDVLYNASVFRNEAGLVQGVFAAARDITERKRAERALRTLSACNEALVRARDEQNLLQRICDLAVSLGGYRMAWVGYAEHDERKTVRPVAQSGVEAGYLDTVDITWADEERGRGPTGTAIRTSIATACRDVTTDPRFAPWRENAVRRGYHSSLVLPLKDGEGAMGAISIYADEVGAFDEAEQHLLEELANNLSYGIVSLRARAEHQRRGEEIRLLNQELEKRVQDRTAELRDSERRVRRKLESILAPEGDLGNLELADILDIPAIQSLLNDFYSVVHVTTALIDLQGEVLAVVGWQKICMQFHRQHPETCKNCVESDMQLSAGVPEGEFKIYKCKNNLRDVATPMMVGGQHMGNLFCGQFFFEDESIDYDAFRSQARQYGFNEDDYIAALNLVPRLNRAAVDASMAFLAKLARMISQLSYSGIKLARSATQIGRANAELAASVKELEAFTYSVSHDLRAPLRHIGGFSKILSEEFGPDLPDDAQHHLRRIQDGTRRMGLLVDDLLNLARVGRRDLSLQVSGLKSIIDEVITELAPECAGRQMEWKIGDLPFVECDPGLMKQVFQNLLSNAVKFTRPRTHAVIEVGQKNEDGTPVVFVRDNGVGFNMKYSDKLFGVFQRLHRSEDFEGTGVGLATVQRIIQKHGGRIWAEAELDKGATFYFTLGASEKNETKTKAAMAGDQA